MSSLSRELVFLILQFLDEEKFKETVHRLEQESGFFFDLKYFEDLVQAGEWDEVEKYLSGFTKVEDNRYSMKIFFEIRKQKYLEALDSQDRAKAVEVLVKDLRVFASFNEDLFKEITQLLTLENFRQNEQLSKYTDTKSARSIMLMELKKLIEANPLFRDKLALPAFKTSRLRTLINQSLNWQHQLCKNPRSNPDIKTLFIDHSCAPAGGARVVPPANSPLLGPVPKPGAYPPAGVHGPFQPVLSPSNALAGWMGGGNPPLPHAAMATAPLGLMPHPNAGPFLKHPRTPTSASAIDYQPADSEHLMKRMRVGQLEEVSFSGSAHSPNIYSLDDLPRTVVRTLNQGSSVLSLDFHPLQQTILLVGTNIGDIGIWEVGSRERIAHKAFKVRDISACSVTLHAALVKDATISVNRCLWSPDGSLIGVAFSKHIIQTYTFNHGDFRLQLEIDAHVGGVNDIAFSHPNKSLSIITCGDDKTIKVWDAATGQRRHTFEGHEAPVYSVCPHYKENIQFIFSTAIDGKIKAWLYDCLGSRVDYDAPGLWCTTMAYSADGTRLFSCGTSKEGESHLVEWNETEGSIKRTYSGFRKSSLGVVQFDTTKNRFLAAGDEFLIKFWDMDNKDVLATADAEGGLPASPRLRFNREGSLLAVTTNDNGVKILASSDGQRLMRMLESRAIEGSRTSSQPMISKAPIVNLSSPMAAAMERPDRALLPSIPMAAGMGSMDSSRMVDVKQRLPDDSDKVRAWKLVDIVDPNQLRALRLSDPTAAVAKIVRLLYTNSGSAVLALCSNAAHKLWKWQRTEGNPSGKSTASFMPQLWQPANGAPMMNDTAEVNPPEKSTPCLALSKNDSYIMSASGGKVSLFNMMTFKVMTTFMPPPPSATFLAFHPQDNNIIAIGMDDSTVQIYNVRVDEVKTKLKGHQKQITGLAFSRLMNVLVSSGADAQLCAWSIDGWEKKKSRFIQPPPGRQGPLTGDTRVQFHNDQTQLLVVHETHLAVYDAKLECLRSWCPRDSLAAPISSAVYSCDGLLVYAGFCDGAVGVLDAGGLRLRCRVAPSAYLAPPPVPCAYPVAIAAHPAEPNQFALGMSDGAVHVVEPPEAEPRWGAPPPPENGSLPPSVPSSSSLSGQQFDGPSR